MAADEAEVLRRAAERYPDIFSEFLARWESCAMTPRDARLVWAQIASRLDALCAEDAARFSFEQEFQNGCVSVLARRWRERAQRT